MKITGKHLIFVLVLNWLWASPARPAEIGIPPANDEIAKQEQIYQSQGENVPEGYVTDRSLLSYMHALSQGFSKSLGKLAAGQRWLDIGAGQGQAIIDYFSSRYEVTYAESERHGGKAQAIALSIEDRRTRDWHQAAAEPGAGQMQYLSGRRLREYGPNELGKFHLITDVIGGFSYAQDLSQFMEKVLAILVVDGNFYTLLQDIHSEVGTNPPYYAGAPYLTEITRADGSRGKVCEWLKSVSCVEVTCELKPDWQPPIETFHIRKTCGNVTVPALMQVHYEAGTPPERRYQWRN